MSHITRLKTSLEDVISSKDIYVYLDVTVFLFFNFI